MKYILLIIALVACVRSSLMACSCNLPPVAVALAEADAVFAGQCTAGKLVTKRIKDRDFDFQYLQFTFQITRTWKGASEKKEIVVETPLDGSMCGYDFRVGMNYIVYCRRSTENFQTDLCTRTCFQNRDPRAEAEMAELTEAALQPSSTP